MNLWILLIALTTTGLGGATAIETIEFYSESSCLMAQVQIVHMAQEKMPKIEVSTVCVRKGKKSH